MGNSFGADNHGKAVCFCKCVCGGGGGWLPNTTARGDKWSVLKARRKRSGRNGPALQWLVTFGSPEGAEGTISKSLWALQWDLEPLWGRGLLSGTWGGGGGGQMGCMVRRVADAFSQAHGPGCYSHGPGPGVFHYSHVWGGGWGGMGRTGPVWVWGWGLGSWGRGQVAAAGLGPLLLGLFLVTAMLITLSVFLPDPLLVQHFGPLRLRDGAGYHWWWVQRTSTASSPFLHPVACISLAPPCWPSRVHYWSLTSCVFGHP